MQVFEVCYALRFWLQWNPKGVAVLFDLTATSGRCMFVVACFQVYMRQQDITIEAFEEVVRLRHPESPGMLSPFSLSSLLCELQPCFVNCSLAL